jgi:aryl-alcohol dehydrogenase-like predicted oxidoreductase
MQLERLHRDPAAARRLLRHAIDLGIDHVDTADFYADGFVNTLIRDELDPEEAVITTKIGAVTHPGGPISLRAAQRPEDLRSSVEDNLQRLGRDRLDVVNLRRVDAGVGIRAEGDQIVALDDQLATLIELRQEGKIAAIGLSNVTLADVRQALPVRLAEVQNSYSVISREDEKIVELCLAESIAWAPFFPLGGAFPGVPKVNDSTHIQRIASRLGVTASQIGLAWLLQHAPNVLLIPGTTSAEHLEENISAGAVTLTADDMTDLDAVFV